LNHLPTGIQRKYFARLVDKAEITENDYNLAVSSYLKAEDKRKIVDIIKLNAKISQIVARENELRQAIDEIIKDIEGA
jgi:type I restriction enzyme M protein